MFGTYRVVRVTPGTVRGFDGSMIEPMSGWMTRREAMDRIIDWAPVTSDRQVLQIERRFTGTILPDSVRGQHAATRWTL